MKINKSHSLSIVLLLIVTFSAGSFVIQWDKIEYWAGSGSNKAALVVQFDDGGAEKAYVWGYRWTDDSVHPSGEDMFRAIATECPDLYLFTQFTGPMGNTVCGIGYSDNNTISGYIEYDFDSAREDPCISFNWFSANTLLGQTSVPGWDTPDLCEDAIKRSVQTHILEHPIDARNYGYACYDYDHWHKFGDLPSMRWQAGWYKGYWSYWVGATDSESLSYSGLGYTSRKLSDGSVDGWKYTRLESSDDSDAVDGYTGASTPWHDLDYKHFDSSGFDQVTTDDDPACVQKIWRIDGTPVQSLSDATPGLYIVKENGKTRKLIVK